MTDTIVMSNVLPDTFNIPNGEIYIILSIVIVFEQMRGL